TKRLELLHGVVPHAKTIGVLVNPTNPNAGIQSKELPAAARSLGINVEILGATSEGDFDSVFTRLVELKAGGLVIGTDGLFISRGERLGALAARHSVPAIFQFRTFAAGGGPMSYGGGPADRRSLRRGLPSPHPQGR